MNLTLILGGGAIAGALGLLIYGATRRSATGSGENALDALCRQFPEDPNCAGTPARAAANARSSFEARQAARASWDLYGSAPAEAGNAGDVVKRVQEAYNTWAGPPTDPRSRTSGAKPMLAQPPSWSNPNNPPANGLTARVNRLKTIGMGQVYVQKSNGHTEALMGPDTGARVGPGQLAMPVGMRIIQYNFPKRTRALQDEGRRRFRELGPGDKEEAVLDWAAYWRTYMPAEWQVPDFMGTKTTSFGTSVPAAVQYLQLSPPRFPAGMGFSNTADAFQESLDFPSWMAFWSPPPAAQQSVHETLAIAGENGGLRISSDPVVKKAVLTLPTASGPRLMMHGTPGMSPDDLEDLLGG